MLLSLFPILWLMEPAQSLAMWVSHFDLCTSVIINGSTPATRWWEPCWTFFSIAAWIFIISLWHDWSLTQSVWVTQVSQCDWSLILQPLSQCEWLQSASVTGPRSSSHSASVSDSSQPVWLVHGPPATQPVWVTPVSLCDWSLFLQPLSQCEWLQSASVTVR